METSPSNPCNEQRLCRVLGPGVELHAYRHLAQAFAPHAHPFYVLGLVTEGRRLLSTGSCKHVLAAGAMVVFNPGDPHGCIAIEHTPLSYLSLCLDCRIVEGFMGFAPRFAGPLLHGEPIRAAFDQLVATAAPNRLVSNTQALRALLTILPQELPAAKTSADILDSMARTISSQPDAPFSLDTVARALHLSRFGASRAFTKRFGLSPDAFRQSERVERARALLVQGTSPSVVASLLGYSDQAHLTRAFKQRTGFTPGAYQKAHLHPSSAIVRKDNL